MRRLYRILLLLLTAILFSGIPALADNELSSQYRLRVWYSYYGTESITVPQRGYFSEPKRVRIKYGDQVIEQMTTTTFPAWINLDDDWVNGKAITLLEIPAPDGYELCFSHQPVIRFGEGMFRDANAANTVVDVMIPVRKAGEKTDFSMSKVLVNILFTPNQGLQYKYTGYEIRPPVQVYLNNIPLREGIDYVINYSNNINKGNASVTAAGIGNFTGSKSKTFQIFDYGAASPGADQGSKTGRAGSLPAGSSFSDGGLVFKIDPSGNAAVTGSLNTNASKITIPSSVNANGRQYKVTSIASGAFQNCAAASVVIGDNVISIGSNAFYNCRKLKKASIGAGVQVIGSGAFCLCRSLRSVKVKSKLLSLKKTGKNAFKKIYKSANFKVPKKKVKAYKKIFRKRGAGEKIKVKG